MNGSDRLLAYPQAKQVITVFYYPKYNSRIKLSYGVPASDYSMASISTRFNSWISCCSVPSLFYQPKLLVRSVVDQDRVSASYSITNMRYISKSIL